MDAPTHKMDCAWRIADLPADRFRCMTIHAKDNGKEVVIRRCSANNECRWQVENNQYSWANVLYHNARCEECQGDYCNAGKLL